MGHNISGIALNKNFENNIEDLANLLNLQLALEKEIDFEEACENWKEESYIDIYFSKNGTLVFANIDFCLEGYYHNEVNILTFALSETSMTFNLVYTENDALVRSIMQVNDEIVDEEGEKLQSEIDNEGDMTETIFDQIGDVIGVHFSEIDLDEKAFRFYLKTEELVSQEETQNIEEELPKRTSPEDEKTNIPTQKSSNDIPKYKEVDNDISSKGIGAEIYVVVIFILAALIGLIYVIVSIFKLS